MIAATHQNLEERVRQGSFREDLYHRLNVIRLRLPPLRERLEDIGVLTRFFLAKSARELGVEAKRITASALERLETFDFPGNVRQLENICHWLTVMAPSQVIEAKDLPPEVALTPGAAPVEAAVRAEPVVRAGGPLEEGITVPPPLAMPAAHAAPILHGGWETGLEAEALELLATGRHDVWDELTKRFESKLILTALANTRGRRIEAAQKLGIGRNTITRKIQELGLE